ncbi:MAG: translation elongation factor Ts [Lachnospiraceae bacterium]|nr:translation elongation factor Ts [Lachnospiraceae bacterium]
MAAITASLVKELREQTGAGMMDCKKALTETNGDMDAAVEYLRKNGQAKAEKKAGRIAAEGLSLVCVKDDHTASIVEVNSETDFVAQNEKFKAFVEDVAAQAAETNASDLDAFMEEKWLKNDSMTVKEALVEQVSVISENLKIRRFEKVTEENGLVAGYIHAGGRISVIVDAECSVVNDEIREALHNVALQVCAMGPKYVSQDEISQEYRDHEKEIIEAQIKNDPKESQKPEKVIQGIVMGRLNKEFKEICLNDQVFVKAEDGKQTVKAYVDGVAKKNNADIKIKRFVRYETGEGLEKKQEDFAAEVASQLK